MSTRNIILAIVAIGFMGSIVWIGGSLKSVKTPVAKPTTEILTVSETPTGIPGITEQTKTNDTTITEIKNTKSMTTATITTNKGVITLELYGSDAPKTVENFKKLANEGFYNGTRFHRVIKGFMIQGGDPLSKDASMQSRWGSGGPGYSFADEIHSNNNNNIGTIAMANSGPNTNGSQFFINVGNNNFLDTKHTVFGRVTAGMEVVTAIENTKTAPGDRPLEDMIVEKMEVK